MSNPQMNPSKARTMFTTNARRVGTISLATPRAPLGVVSILAMSLGCSQAPPEPPSTELTRDEATRLLWLSGTPETIFLVSPRDACHPDGRFGVGNGALVMPNDPEVQKPYGQSSYDVANRPMFDQLMAAGLLSNVQAIGECTGNGSSCLRRTRIYTGRYHAPMQIHPTRHNARIGAARWHACAVPYASLGPAQVTGVSNTGPASATATWERPWIINTQAQTIRQMQPSFFDCHGCPSPGARARGQSRFQRFDDGWREQ
ncbi:MAG: hypothetical protein H6716_28880 [Polyangiaceae bacterium]|nr:hypothetical protein [Polyangiaceae bacterium]